MPQAKKPITKKSKVPSPVKMPPIEKQIFPGSEQRFIVDRYYQVQKQRIAMGNEIFQLNKLEIDPVALNRFYEDFYTIEKDMVKYLKKVMKDHEMGPYFESVKGIGPVLGAALVSFIDIEKAQHASSVWKYCGLAPGQKRKKGVKLDYNPVMKTIAWKIGEQFVKTPGKYRDIYVTSRAYYQEKFPKPIPVPNTKGQMTHVPAHLHAMAKRRTVKIFLSEFWAEWRKVRGLPVSEPFAHRIGAKEQRIEEL